MRPSPKQQIIETSSPTLRQRADALRARVAEPIADPIIAVIEANRRLMPAVRRARRVPDVSVHRPVEQEMANDALWLHFGTLLKTAPTTPAGAIALARHVLAFHRFQGRVLEEEELIRVLSLIASVSGA